jgi:ATP-dependent DNA helicase PIF1
MLPIHTHHLPHSAMSSPLPAAIASESLTITPGFAAARTVLEDGRNVLITGKAGTGKTTFLDWFRDETTKNVAVVAPTGVAALNVRGQTIHSLFELKPGFMGPERDFKLRNKKLIKSLDLLIIDEISMVRADLFDAMLTILQQYGPHPQQPFGGVQLCLVGDLFQLPPIISPDEREAFQHVYAGPYFFHARQWQPQAFTTIAFDDVFRQRDPAFISVLNRIREGSRAPELLAMLNTQVGAAPEDSAGVVTLTTTNARATQINEGRMAGLPQPGRVYAGEAAGNFAATGQNLPAPDQLLLKPGAQVMFTRNDLPGRRWVNGTLGVVRHLEAEAVLVEVNRGDRQRLYEVERETWKSIKYRLDAESGEIREEETGHYTQFPLTPAWAVTIHKSQGKTLDRVLIDLDRGAFAPGQLYVALSRCRTLEHLTLTRPVTPADIRVDPRVVAFLQLTDGQ